MEKLNEKSVTQLHNIDPDILLGLFNDLKGQISQLQEQLLPTTKERYLTRKQVAEMFSINVSTVSLWQNNSTLYPLQLGGRVYFRLSDIEANLHPINEKKQNSSEAA